ncbi:patatin-like phospholipase [Diplogelasinospora grovesii]|uniref:Patatin-like phospholipase n=1 Tax=Diplogelasinospora grovesii TaxID=303347 RepID=A0AAN6NGJ7_9PEZI|nr:patatin-like phospholipase [Diplogelasinospora grovesii]
MAEQPKSPATDFAIPSKRYGFPPEAFDWSRLPDVNTDFLSPEDIGAFIQALSAPDPLQSPDDASSYRLGSPALQQSTSSLDHITKRFSVSDPNSQLQQQEDYKDEDPQVVAAHAAAAAGEPVGSGAVAPQPSPRFPRAQSPSVNRSNGSSNLFISAKNDWAPVHEKVLGSGKRSERRGGKKHGKSGRKRPAPFQALVGSRSKDETREGYLYNLLKWPFLLIVGAWIFGLGVAYLATRSYIYLYEQFIAWRGQRERLRRAMRATGNYKDWVAAARHMDDFFGNGKWKEEDDFAYYDSKTVRRVWDQLRKCRAKAEAVERDMVAPLPNGTTSREMSDEGRKAVEDLKALIEAAVKNNFVGIENPRLYSQTYYGTKNLVQNFVDEVEKSIKFLISTKQLSKEEKRVMFKGICANYGRTALCLSGGATFAYYHFGVVKALLDEDQLPDIITGTSGGALVAALVATRTNEELKELLVPSLARRITACREPVTVWFRRWWKTGARFDSVDWAKKCSWFTRGSMTFREAYERTGRILNVSCVPADPHSPTILCNYLTSPDCVIWSAVLASAAVPGILNPVVLMMKTRNSGQLIPYSFGHKWKDGSLRTDIPIKALNLHFNVNFTIVSQVNPHINLFFFSSRGSVGSPVTHRKGRGWRGGYLGSATEQYIKLDLNKWLKVLRHLELLPRPLGQDWSQLWLQQFGGTVTIWPKSIVSDFIHILSDPDAARLARMIHEGQQSAFPKLKFIANRLKVERLIEQGRRESRPSWGGGDGGGGGDGRRGSIESILSEDDLRRRSLLIPGGRKKSNGIIGTTGSTTATEDDDMTSTDVDVNSGHDAEDLDGEDSSELLLMLMDGQQHADSVVKNNDGGIVESVESVEGAGLAGLGAQQ